ncbi:MalY/PatB family protein [Lachnoclostridium sp. Marseille-P6806]|uniref:MalY/PatB family protein n=1 Tax=Lachnoclostridium sp. Marseille-P6806 TaxID=2364793 RepID=UPI00102F8242|nr:PatB family C-S lyase [Lachnoclostridium sp. Marseille-P6806]
MFKQKISRIGTNCAKWDEIIEKNGNPLLIPLTVADMDFPVAPEIMSEIIRAAAHGIYGYTNVSEKYLALSKKWIEDHYAYPAEKEWIVYCPRIIQAISLFIQNNTAVGDKIMVLTPLYDPIQSAVRINKRELVTSSLVIKGRSYQIDFEDFRAKIAGGVKMFIMVSPHNPTGRVWDEAEIRKMIEICREYHVLIFSDEVHADFTWEKNFISFGRFFDTYENIIIGTSASKTFNIPGLEASNIIIKNEKLRNELRLYLRQAGIHNPSYFCIPAVEAAYESGEEWLLLAKKAINDNRCFARNFFENELKGFKVMNSDGTFLLWVDYRESNLSEDELKNIMYHKANVVFSTGSDFGREGVGFIRINVALPQALLKEALHRFKESI